MSDALAKREDMTLVNPVAAMLQNALAQGITKDNAEALEKMTALYMQVEDRNSAKEFASAKCAMQAELPRVIAQKVIPGKGGVIRSSYAPFEDLMETVQPYLSKYGFSISFTTAEATNNRVCAVCKLSHSAGHSETNQFSVRVGSGQNGNTDAQADMGGLTTAKRGALACALNIVINCDADARNEGDYISAEQAMSLRARVESTGSDEKRFLKFANAQTYEQIRCGKYAALDNFLLQKERNTNSPQGQK